ncbi:hypothetical protein ElyMa_000415600 [Elysia marginata]|uniref:Mutator-like transposase domain-containing protein n=1 Tax=Elysia marginata TaxID=1093978 RepID=A0AAV4FKK4_9GAST|nr:hypothetical protein ElyMa_000415600 [Elysia marginata]
MHLHVLFERSPKERSPQQSLVHKPGELQDARRDKDVELAAVPKTGHQEMAPSSLFKRDLLTEFIEKDLMQPAQGTIFVRHLHTFFWQFNQYVDLKTFSQAIEAIMVMDFAENRKAPSTVESRQKPIESLSVVREYKGGLSWEMKVWCDTCEEFVFLEFSFPGGRRKDVTKTVVLAAKESGLGYKALCNFFSILNMPKPLHHKTFQQISSSVHTAAVAEAEKCMKKAADRVVTSTTVGNPGKLPVPATAVSYDGTWHKWEHSSHFGVGVVIDCKSGFVLDTQVLSNYCHGCEVGPKPESPLYLQRRAKHSCQKNFDGSSNAMETEAAVAIFRRSIHQRGLVYSKMLCDGDLKANRKINEGKMYGFEVVKEDCVNHISKRMFNALETVKNSNKKRSEQKTDKNKY